jgi:hypothetical protein
MTHHRLLTVCLIILICEVIGACNDEKSWKEEVLLHDGRKIIAERAVERGGRHEIGQKPPYKEQSLVFTMPGTDRQVTWEDKFSKDFGHANFLPMLLEIRNGVSYLVASTMGCKSYNKWGRPNPPYVLFKYDEKLWQRIPLQELPAEIKVPNLIFSSPDIAVEKSGKRFISAEMIKQLREGYKQPEYKTILREPMRQGSGFTSCEIPTTATGKLIVPEVDGKPLYNNWWPLASEWLKNTYGRDK